MASAVRTVRLRDGSSIDIRPISPADRQLLREGFARLSPESRYRRFFGPMAELSERDLDYLTDVDHRAHEALVAIDPHTGEGVGVARFVRTGPGVAEPAMVVVDDWHGRGVGSQLLRDLVRRARQEGIDRFQAPVLATNHEALHVLESLGRTTRHLAGPEVDLTIDLTPEAPAPGWADMLRQFAVGAFEPARTLLDRLWPRRPGSPGDKRSNVIVVGTDASQPNSEAVRMAARLARGSGARVEVVSVYRFGVGERERLTAAARAVAAGLRADGIEAREHVRRGDPALAITDVATRCHARLIVVGAGELDGTWRWVLGTVADAVAERTPCDLLIVRPRPGLAT